jgi:hypothetical protein
MRAAGGGWSHGVMQPPPRPEPPRASPRRNRTDAALSVFGIACVVLFVVLGLAIVGAFVAFGVAMSRYGSNK